MIERGKGYFNELWRNILNGEQRNILTQFMLEGHLDGIPKAEINRLIFKEILEKKNGDYQFQVPITERYLRQQVE